VLTCRDESEIFAHSDTLGKLLGFSIYSQDDAFVDRKPTRTSSGGVNRPNAARQYSPPPSAARG
jgi:hypothetical protein